MVKPDGAPSSRTETSMLDRRVPLLLTLACSSAALFESRAYSQPLDPAAAGTVSANAAAKDAGATAGVAQRADDLQRMVEALQAENATIKEQLRKVEAQQQKLIELVAGSGANPAVVPVS